MAFALNNGVRLHWRIDGAADKPVLVLLNSIGTDIALYDAAVPYLIKDFRLLRIDARGHGASDATDGDYSLDLLADDVLAVMDEAGVETAAVCGTSMGGMVAMTLALKAPCRVTALVLACTSAAIDPAIWAARGAAVRDGGTAAIADMAMIRFFSDSFRDKHPEAVETVRANLLAQNAHGYAACAAAIRDMDLASAIPGIAVPTLVIGGSKDIALPFVGHGDVIAAAIVGAHVTLLDTAHLPSIEAPASFAAAVRGFMAQVRDGTAKADANTLLFEEGLKNRRKVLGDAWVDKSLAGRTPFNADYQAMITRYAWNEVWGRPGLDHRTRRLLVVAICASLGRWEEFRLHVKSALEQDGFTQDELKEVLMQTAIYAGVPAANTGFNEAAEIIRNLEP